MNYPDSLLKVIKLLSELPGIGKKTAERLSFNMVKSEGDYLYNLSDSLEKLKKNIKKDPICGCMIDSIQCLTCNNQSRNHEIICVVKEQQDVFCIEKSGFKGIYHVLGGLISPLDGILIDDLNFKN